jgi:hypothetical protein
MSRFLIALIFVLGFQCKADAQTKELPHGFSNGLTHADVDFFFTSFALRNGKWAFKLSPNTNGMLWNIRKDDSNLTGACESGAELEVPVGAIFEVKRKDIRLVLIPRGALSFDGRLTVQPVKNITKGVEEREGIIIGVPGRNYAYGIAHVED